MDHKINGTISVCIVKLGDSGGTTPPLPAWPNLRLAKNSHASAARAIATLTLQPLGPWKRC